MSFIPEDELKAKASINFAPMIDFLFLMLLFFASIAVTRIATRDTKIDLVQIQPEKNSSSDQGESAYKVVHINVAADGSYTWVTDMRDHPMEDAIAVAKELQRQQAKGLLPEERSKTHVLLKIDKAAPWEPVMQLLFAVRDVGFDAHPVYLPEKEVSLNNFSKGT